MKFSLVNNILIALCALFFLAGCNLTKRLGEDEYLLKKNKIIVEDDARISKSSVEEIIKQQPNRKILGFIPFYLWAYNVPNPEKFDKINERRAKRFAKKNQRRIAKGKPVKVPRAAGSVWRETIGEDPVVVDSTEVEKSVSQIQLSLVKHGWFNATVRDSITYFPNKKKAVVSYKITGREPYFIDSLNYNIPDNYLTPLTIKAREERTFIKRGDQFNVDRLDREREMLNQYFRNRGYFMFNKEMIYFDVDSALNNNKVNLVLGIRPNTVPYSGDPDSLLTVPHIRYFLKDIVITDKPAGRNNQSMDTDRIEYDNYTILDADLLKVKPKILTRNVIFKEGEYYSLENVTRTYRRLAVLPPVRAVNMQFLPIEEAADSNELRSIITLNPAEKQNVSLEWKGTNRGGFLGVSGVLSYNNRNLFRGAELFSINLSGGLEAQRLLTDQASEEAVIDVGDELNLNTLEFGPEISLTFPKFLLPIGPENFSKSADPKTTFNSSLSYQRRPDYTRTRSNFSLIYRWSESEFKRWLISPLEVSLIKIDKSLAFQNRLNEINDLYLINSYQDHFIAGGRVAYIFNNQQKGSSKDVFYFRSELEFAGNLLSQIYKAGDQPTDSTGSYQILGINFAQYVKTTNDFRYYHKMNNKMSTAYRFIAGVGIPFNNLNVLPFEKSYYAGGANDIRAWQARTLGPGSYTDVNTRYDKIGDILIEANAEYRFALIDVLEGALFVDAGNIWTLREEAARPNAHFELQRFYKEIAVGLGAGLRLNFDFFLIRFDLGLQFRDPGLPIGERWLFQKKTIYNNYIDELNEFRPENSQLNHYNLQWNINLGIGYPF